MKINSRLTAKFDNAADALSPKLTWNASTVAEHRAWRGRFRRRLAQLLGHEPHPAPLAVEWAEERRFSGFGSRRHGSTRTRQ